MIILRSQIHTMGKLKTRRAAHDLIFKENKSHQEAFDTLSKEISGSKEGLAGEVSAIPSKAQYDRIKILIYIYVAFLSIVLILRSIGIYFVAQDIEQPVILLLLVALGIFLPVLGIFGALTARMEIFKSVGILMAMNIFRSISNSGGLDELTLYVTIGLFAVCAGLAFFIPTRINTPFTKQLVETEIDGETKNSMQYTFETTNRNENNELLDTL
ncbi:MAG: hypothetical protein ACJA1C_001256 [Crocinitomicaceae bacterium]|jgi:hypothetical protein